MKTPENPSSKGQQKPPTAFARDAKPEDLAAIAGPLLAGCGGDYASAIEQAAGLYHAAAVWLKTPPKAQWPDAWGEKPPEPAAGFPIGFEDFLRLLAPETKAPERYKRFRDYLGGGDGAAQEIGSLKATGLQREIYQAHWQAYGRWWKAQLSASASARGKQGGRPAKRRRARRKRE